MHSGFFLICTCACMCAHAHTHTHTRTHEYTQNIYTCTHSYTHTHTHTQTDMNTHKTYICTHSYTHTYKHTHTHTHRIVGGMRLTKLYQAVTINLSSSSCTSRIFSWSFCKPKQKCFNSQYTNQCHESLEQRPNCYVSSTIQWSPSICRHAYMSDSAYMSGDPLGRNPSLLCMTKNSGSYMLGLVAASTLIWRVSWGQMSTLTTNLPATVSAATLWEGE